MMTIEQARLSYPVRIILLALLVVLVGIATVVFPPSIFLVVAAVAVVVAACFVDKLPVVFFWTLPYMVVNMPTGAFTLKLPEAVAYLFGAAFLVRCLLRRTRIVPPPATFAVAIYLAVLAISTACSPAVPHPFLGDIRSMDRNSPNLRSVSIIIWLALSWLVVTAIYNVVGRDPKLYVKCIRAHVLSSGLASLISIGIYVLALSGFTFTNLANDRERSLAPTVGDVFRLAGVAYEPLFLAFYLVSAIPLTVTVLVSREKILPWPLVLLVLLVQSVAMFLTFSTGGCLSLAIALMLIIPLWRTWRIKGRLAIACGAIAATVAAVLIALYATKPALPNMLYYASTKLTQGGDSLRKEELTVGYALASRHPVLGVGPGMAHYHFPRFHPRLAGQLPHIFNEINNVYLNALAETGVVGFAALIMMGLTGVRSLAITLRKCGPANAPALWALFASLIGCAVQYLSLNSLFLIYFCGLIGIAVAGARLAPTGIERLSLRGEDA
jgi:O-antigen ligase